MSIEHWLKLITDQGTRNLSQLGLELLLVLARPVVLVDELLGADLFVEVIRDGLHIVVDFVAALHLDELVFEVFEDCRFENIDGQQGDLREQEQNDVCRLETIVFEDSEPNYRCCQAIDLVYLFVEVDLSA